MERSIAQTFSLKPLNVTEELMRKVLTYHQVTPDFLAILFSCGDHPQAGDTGSGNWIIKQSLDGKYGEELIADAANQNRQLTARHPSHRDHVHGQVCRGKWAISWESIFGAADGHVPPALKRKYVYVVSYTSTEGFSVFFTIESLFSIKRQRFEAGGEPPQFAYASSFDLHGRLETLLKPVERKLP